jgi:hypothetical protein
MNERSPRLLNRLRIFVPLAVLVLILAGATTAFASGAFESNDSGFDSARDITERGSVAASTTTTSQPDPTDDKGVDAVGVSGVATQTQDQATSNVPDGTTATFAAGDAGSVTIRRTGATLSIVSVNGNPGWSSEVEQGTGAEIEVKFVNGTTRIDFSAELEDGGVQVRVRVGTADSNATGVDNSGPGNASDDKSADDNSGPGNTNDSNSGPGNTNDSNSGHGGSGHSSDG